MKKFNRVICCLIVLMLNMFGVYAAENSEYADKLNELGLFRGTENGYELNRTLSREESVTMLVRLLGAEETALDASYSEVFRDVDRERWSFPYVMYCWENGITKGTGADEFTPEAAVSAEEFITLVLRLLGYEAEPENAYSEAVSACLLSTDNVRQLQKSEDFLREDMVFVAYRSLKTKNSDGIVPAKVLAETGVITDEQADEFDIYKEGNDMDDILEGMFD